MINQNNEKSIAKLSQGGVPSYAGLTGNALLAAVVATGTVGFALFGYGECLFLYATGQQSAIPRIVVAPAEFSASIQSFPHSPIAFPSIPAPWPLIHLRTPRSPRSLVACIWFFLGIVILAGSASLRRAVNMSLVMWSGLSVTHV